MRRINLGACILGTFVAFAAVMNSGDAKSDSPAPGTGGVATVYGNISPDQVEFLSSGDRIIASTSSGSPSLIWETLEHGEKVECLSCIPAVAPLIYDADPHTREIAAWWLRRRMFGVFGPGEVYQQTLGTLADQSQSPARRADAAYAIGEFLEQSGVSAEATAIATDPDPTVRAAAAAALGRLNDEGSGALSKSLADTDSRVKLAGLKSAGRVNTFSDIAAVSALLGDGDSQVRRSAAEILDQMHAKDSVGALVAMAQNDSDANVRGAACHALGSIGDASAKTALTAIAANDSDSLVRDLAQMALLQL